MGTWRRLRDWVCVFTLASPFKGINCARRFCLHCSARICISPLAVLCSEAIRKGETRVIESLQDPFQKRNICETCVNAVTRSVPIARLEGRPSVCRYGYTPPFLSRLAVLVLIMLLLLMLLLLPPPPVSLSRARACAEVVV